MNEYNMNREYFLIKNHTEKGAERPVPDFFFVF